MLNVINKFFFLETLKIILGFMLYYLSFYIVWHICLVGVRKKTEKPIKPRKPENNNRKNQTVKKNQLNRLKF